MARVLVCWWCGVSEVVRGCVLVVVRAGGRRGESDEGRAGQIHKDGVSVGCECVIFTAAVASQMRGGSGAVGEVVGLCGRRRSAPYKFHGCSLLAVLKHIVVSSSADNLARTWRGPYARTTNETLRKLCLPFSDGQIAHFFVSMKDEKETSKIAAHAAHPAAPHMHPPADVQRPPKKHVRSLASLR